MHKRMLVVGLLVAGARLGIAAAPAPLAHIEQAWDGGHCSATLLLNADGCRLRGEVESIQHVSEANGGFQAEVSEPGTFEAQLRCGSRARACDQIVRCTCGAPDAGH